MDSLPVRQKVQYPADRPGRRVNFAPRSKPDQLGSKWKPDTTRLDQPDDDRRTTLILIMPLDLQIIRASEFIRLGAQGHFDLAASKAALAEIAAACRKRGINQALLDLRGLRPGPKPVFSPADLIELVNTFREVGFTHEERLAILYHSDPHHRARLFAFLSIVRGWNVRAFGDFEQAILWLGEGTAPATAAPRSPGEKRIPVRDRKRESNRPARPRRTKTVKPRSPSPAD